MARWHVKQAKVAKVDGLLMLRGAALMCVLSQGAAVCAQSSASSATETVRLNLDTQQAPDASNAGPAVDGAEWRGAYSKAGDRAGAAEQRGPATGEYSVAAGGPFGDDHQGGISAEFVCRLGRGVYLWNS